MRRLLASNRNPDDAGIAYRASSAGCVVVAVIAAVTQGAVSVSTGWLAVLLVPIGTVFSYIRRGNKNVGVKLALTAGLFIAFAAFLQGVRGAETIDDTRTPLVAVFLWVQVMHSFDVPRARDLTFSIAASVVLLALAGSLAFSTGFIVYVLAHAALFMASLVFGYRADLRKVADDVVESYESVRPAATHRRERSAFGRRIAALGVVTLVCTAVVFVFLPRLPAQQVTPTLPFSFGNASPLQDFVGDVELPSDEGGSDDVGSDTAFDPDSYFGYGDSLNLRVRGTLSDDLVMRVRAPRPSLYRAQAYDRYSDGRWTSTDAELDELSSGGLGSIFVPDLENQPTFDELVQTFYIERALPNIVFHAYRAHELFVSDTRVRVDDFGSIRLPFTLEADTIYSVVSRTPTFEEDELRFAGPVNASDPTIARYLQVPGSLDERFHELAREITDPHPAIVDKAEAVQVWLRENKKYRLDIPRDPPNRDPVDVFVFDRDEGFCEQIAATMALMLRASGVPTRVVTGFGPGERNLFTGYWEVKNSDAHAWVEVHYPGLGWIPYDPTFGVPLSSAANTTFMLAPLKKITEAFPTEAIKSVGRFASRTVGSLPGPTWIGAILLIGAFGTLAFAGVRARTRRRLAARDPTDRVVAAWLALERALAARGVRREEHETALEFARRASSVAPPVDDLAHEFSEARYSGGEPDVAAFEEHVGRVTRAVARKE